MKTISTANTKQKCKLSMLAKVISGLYQKVIPNGDIAYIQVKDLQADSFGTSAMSLVKRKANLDDYLLQKGDILFAGKGATYMCKVFDYDFPAVASTSFFTIRILTDAVNPEYLCWYLNHPKVIAQIMASRAGSGTPLIHKPTLENIEVIIPDKVTQQCIVELSALQKREESLLKSIAEKRSIITNQLLMNKISK